MLNHDLSLLGCVFFKLLEATEMNSKECQGYIVKLKSVLYLQILRIQDIHNILSTFNVWEAHQSYMLPRVGGITVQLCNLLEHFFAF